MRMATLRDSEPKAPRAPKLSSLQKNALHVLEKYGELMLGESGVFFCAMVGGGAKAVLIRQLAELGYCRIDVVGKSTFAVFIHS
jgi:hypothetical protein